MTGTINQSLFQASIGQSYLCNAEQDFNATTTNINSLTVELVDVQLQAYSTSKTDSFATGKYRNIVIDCVEIVRLVS